MRIAPPPAPEKPENPRRRNLVAAKFVSELLGIPLTSLYDATRRGEIPGVVKIGTRIRYDLDLLNAWLDAGGDQK